MIETHFSSAFGTLALRRYPRAAQEKLRAWDAADELVLAHLSEQAFAPDAKLAIVNDGFGALGVSLREWQPTLINDSWLSQQGIRQNALDNGIDLNQLDLLHSLQLPEHPIDLLIIKIPKNLAYLEDMLIRLKPCMAEQGRIVLAGMVKHIPGSVWKLVEKTIGQTQTSLAVKKAKLIHTRINKDIAEISNPYPTQYVLQDKHWTISNHSNVFSRQSLDIGTRFFIDHFPDTRAANTVVDLGCGNGLLGLYAALQNPDADLVFVDESQMAVASAKANVEQVFPDRKNAQFIWGNSLESLDKQSADVILCNPPFHQQSAVTDQTAMAMFKNARRVLKPGGKFYVIGNRHLGYHVKLRKLFPKVQQIASNKKFVIFAASV